LNGWTQGKDNEFLRIGYKNNYQNRTLIKTSFPEVWYASEKKANRPFKLIVYDDKGSMDITNRVIHFKGKFKGYNNDILIKKRNINKVKMSPQRINWIIYLIINIILMTYFFCFFNNFIIIIINIIILAIMDGFGLWVAKSTKWVVIEYLENNTMKQVWFANGSKLGWSGIFGGTKKIYESIIDRT
jgi:hypothetical protein